MLVSPWPRLKFVAVCLLYKHKGSWQDRGQTPLVAPFCVIRCYSFLCRPRLRRHRCHCCRSKGWTKAWRGKCLQTGLRTRLLMKSSAKVLNEWNYQIDFGAWHLNSPLWHLIFASGTLTPWAYIHTYLFSAHPTHTYTKTNIYLYIYYICYNHDNPSYPSNSTPKGWPQVSRRPGRTVGLGPAGGIDFGCLNFGMMQPKLLIIFFPKATPLKPYPIVWQEPLVNKCPKLFFSWNPAHDLLGHLISWNHTSPETLLRTYHFLQFCPEMLKDNPPYVP